LSAWDVFRPVLGVNISNLKSLFYYGTEAPPLTLSHDAMPSHVIKMSPC